MMVNTLSLSPPEINPQRLLSELTGLAAKGRHVFPAGRDKKPLIKDWSNQATIDEQQLCDWFDKPQPPNIAVITGHRSGFFCLDVDGAEGRESLQGLESQHGQLDQSCLAQTASSGLHYYFKMPLEADIRNSAGKLAPGLDIRGNGGYVIVPPSQALSRGGQLGSYEWLSEITLANGELPVSPEWLLNLILKPTVKPSLPFEPAKSNNTATTAYGRKALEEEAQTVRSAQPGKRNDTLNRSAFAVWQLVNGGEIEDSEAEKDLTEAAISTGLELREIERTLKSAQQKAGTRQAEKMTIPDVSELPTIPYFEISEPPLEAFPPKIQKLLKEAATAFKQLPLEVPIVALLSLLSACVGRSRVLAIKDDWEEAGNLYFGLVANSGLGKSPCFKEFFKPLWKAETKIKAAWDKDMAAYNAALEDRRQTKSQDRADLGELPPRPIRTQYIVEDVTIEAIGNILADNPRGLLWSCDELASIILNLDRYSNAKGGTKTKLLSTYSGAPWKINRRDNEKDQVIPSAVLSIAGTVQPKILRDLFSEMDALNGFLPRFILIRAERKVPALLGGDIFTGQEILQKIADNLLSFQMPHDGHEYKPAKVRLSPTAYQAYIDWHNWKTAEAWQGSEFDQSICAKLVAQVARIALLLHCLEAALQEGDTQADISERTMRSAMLIGEWAQGHQKQVWLGLGLQDEAAKTPLEKAIMEVSVGLESTLTANQWRIPNDDFYALIKTRFGEEIDASVIGRTVTKLGIISHPVGKKRGREFNPEIISSFRQKLYL